MARCEDFPCCGHELGCCPDFDEAGRQLNMKCTCGATVPLGSQYSICSGCMEDPTPWCIGCGAMTEKGCDCGPLAEND